MKSRTPRTSCVLSTSYTTRSTREYTEADIKKHNKGRLIKLLDIIEPCVIDKFKYDEEGLWSLTRFKIGSDICKFLLSRKDVSEDSVITDAFAGVGGTTLQFADHFKRVNAIEMNEERFAMLNDNINLFSFWNVSTYKDYYQNHMFELRQDIIFFDPPWPGGNKYDKISKMTWIPILNKDKEQVGIEDMVKIMAPYAKYCVVKLPGNYDEELFTLRIKSKGDVIHRESYPRPFTSLIIYIRYIRSGSY